MKAIINKNQHEPQTYTTNHKTADKMTTYDYLRDYALQLVEDVERAEVFVTETLQEAGQMTTLDTSEKVNQFLLVTLRNKCYDYLRLGKSDELKASELDIPICRLRPELEAIISGKFF